MGPLPDDEEREKERRRRRREERHRAAITLVEVALHRHRIKDWESATPVMRKKVLSELKQALEALDVPHPKDERDA